MIEQLKLFEVGKPSVRATLMAWIDARIRLFEGMTPAEQARYVLGEVLARFEAGTSPYAEVEHWLKRVDDEVGVC